MASILDVSASSDSEDDFDYIPTGGPPSESSDGDGENSSDEQEVPKPKRFKKKKSSKGRSEEDKEVPKENKEVPKEDKEVPKKEIEVIDLVDDDDDIEADPKKHADDVWKSFLNEVEASSSTANNGSDKPCTMTSADVLEEMKSSAKVPMGSPSEEPTTSVFEFAGETFTVKNDSSPSASLAQTEISDSPPATELKAAEADGSKKRGLDSVLGTLFNKKQKLTTLEKTLHDWKSFKKDEGIEEDLEQFNKGRGGFIERQRFLQRSDVRSFEVEKNIRQSRKKK